MRALTTFLPLPDLSRSDRPLALPGTSEELPRRPLPISRLRPAGERRSKQNRTISVVLLGLT